MTANPQGRPAPNVAVLRDRVGAFGRTPPAARPARVAQIRTDAERLGAAHLGWVRAFLAKHDPTWKPPPPAAGPTSPPTIAP